MALWKLLVLDGQHYCGQRTHTRRNKHELRRQRHQASGIKILIAGGGIQTTWFVTDFMLGPGMLGGSTRIDDWR